jgi:hypothetical protein
MAQCASLALSLGHKLSLTACSGYITLPHHAATGCCCMMLLHDAATSCCFVTLLHHVVL